MVSVWSKNSNVAFYDGSQNGEVRAAQASNGLFEVHPTVVANKGWKDIGPQIKEGGM